jgi:hypothetical protein
LRASFEPRGVVVKSMAVVVGATLGDFFAFVVLVFFDVGGDAFALPWTVFGALGPVVLGAVVFGAGAPAFLPVAVAFGAPPLPRPALPLAAVPVGTRTRHASAINVAELFRSLIA